MSYLYAHQTELCLLALSFCVLVFCIYIQWGKGERSVTWILGAMGVGAVVLTMVCPFLSGGHFASSGTAYACLAGALAVMLNAARKLRAERLQRDGTLAS